MRNLFVAGVFTAALAALPQSGESAPRSASGPRGPSGGVEVAPVDRLGPTLAPDNSLTADSGWNGSASAGVAGPALGPTDLQPLFSPPAQPPNRKHKPYIILNK